MTINTPPPNHGGKRPGAGRKPKFLSRLIRTTISLPEEIDAQLKQQYGSIQRWVDHETLNKSGTIKKKMRTP